MSKTILHIDSSARFNDSLSRQVTRYVADQLAQKNSQNIIYRDLSVTELPLVTEAHIGAYYTDAQQRSDEQKALLGISDQLIEELKAAQQLIIGAPMYNFSVPASLKAWIDLVCRVGETFSYGDSGPEGLLNIKEAFLVVSTGGTPLGSDADFNSGYLKQICRFIGIDTVHIINVSGSKRDSSIIIDHAKAQVDALLNNMAN